MQPSVPEPKSLLASLHSPHMEKSEEVTNFLIKKTLKFPFQFPAFYA